MMEMENDFLFILLLFHLILKSFKNCWLAAITLSPAIENKTYFSDVFKNSRIFVKNVRKCLKMFLNIFVKLKLFSNILQNFAN